MPKRSNLVPVLRVQGLVIDRLVIQLHEITLQIFLPYGIVSSDEPIDFRLKAGENLSEVCGEIGGDRDRRG
jgi:hypothetical protein